MVITLVGATQSLAYIKFILQYYCYYKNSLDL